MISEIKSIVLNDTLYDIKDTKARLDTTEETANRTSADNELQTAFNFPSLFKVAIPFAVPKYGFTTLLLLLYTQNGGQH